VHLRLISYNIRKAKGGWRHRTSSREIGEALMSRSPDIVLCQEVFHSYGPGGVNQSAEISERLGIPAAYGANAVYSKGHHGNATLTRFDILASRNFDLSTNPIERRGVLWGLIDVEGQPLHVFNTHLGLNRRQRRRQVARIADAIEALAVKDQPLILGGDFNDWTGRLDAFVRERCGVESSRERLTAVAHASYPNLRPLLSLDRLYWRGLELESLQVLQGEPWIRISDHLPLEATFQLRSP